MTVRLALVFACGLQAVVWGQPGEIVVAADLGAQIEPIARVTGSTWTAITASRALAGREWTRWPRTDGAPSSVLRVTGPGGRCDSPRRLTVVSSPARPLDSPYVGLAATGAAEIDRLRRVTARAPSWKTLTEAITPLFERRARTHGVSASLLARTPMSVDWVFASGSDVPDVFYFEASKRIPDAGGTPVEDPIGEVGVVVSGWFRQVNAELVHLASKSELFWGPEEASPQPRLLPLGVLRHGSERVWVMARPGARDAFSLYAVRGSSLRTVLTVEAGQC